MGRKATSLRQPGVKAGKVVGLPKTSGGKTKEEKKPLISLSAFIFIKKIPFPRSSGKVFCFIPHWVFILHFM